MRFTPFVLALAGNAAVLAQTFADYQNPFNIPSTGIAFTAGQPTTLNWQPTTSGTVTLVLRQGASNNLAQGAIIQSKIPNSGSYTWTPPSDIVRGSDYTIEIVDDTNPSRTNYTPYFVIDSANTVSSGTAIGQFSTVTYGAPSASLSLTTASTQTSSNAAGSTGATASTSGAAAPTTTGSVASSVLSTASAAASSASAAAAASVSSGVSSASAAANSVSTLTGTASSMATSASPSGSATSAASSSAARTSSAAATTSAAAATGAAVAWKAPAGFAVLGALGALAL
ncbi:hypothetical protein LTR16_002547 [Cryomyces antarcticus]|uniref:Yeast cell wall synthesis Kre9/Knh1-like N-terminal domain-containing protein n=1 Tax=Cryomyces antarcticus TaxID=329879 RepID=A0ABR0KT60_9PEZI|nr:hypothetical protein LTR39_001950 [Cryomyces antarcticus]KAK5017530.1 hypothetical protein LTR60_001894 [Cryomyces antarcticus]KAK5128605.1 hypothetical protein LTR16_002547 [Cryomyces antarcticus]KAK5142889.1 hypothetical protein LTR04_002076 [Oleoguttula sp. CCFEE 6159]